MPASDTAPAVAGVPRLLLRLEGLAVAAVAVLLYQRLGENWWLFVVLILAPDLSFLGYLAGPRIGAIAYNAAHTLIVPMLLALAGMLLPFEPAIAISLIWTVHIGVDRLIGYGLKYDEGFAFTHLGHIGRAA
jgi:hypothetical protein